MCDVRTLHQEGIVIVVVLSLFFFISNSCFKYARTLQKNNKKFQFKQKLSESFQTRLHEKHRQSLFFFHLKLGHTKSGLTTSTSSLG